MPLRYEPLVLHFPYSAARVLDSGGGVRATSPLFKF
jgi:hypothetical protein